MGLFSFFQSDPSKKFVSEKEYKSNVAKQLTMTPQTLKQLRKYNVTDAKELKLEYFFYTNTIDKAKAFASEISKLNYTVNFGKAAGTRNQFVITGWTTKIQMSDTVVLAWTKQMCELGYQFDCDFDGWGTKPDQ